MKRKIKPETKIANQRRDIRALKVMLGWAAKQLRAIADGSKAGCAVDEAATKAAEECESWVARIK